MNRSAQEAVLRAEPECGVIKGDFVGDREVIGEDTVLLALQVFSVVSHLRLENGWLLYVLLTFAPFRYRRPSRSELDIVWRAANEKAKVGSSQVNQSLLRA